jgi:GxxExxY protein
MTGLRRENLTYEIRGLIFEVRNELQTGWPEEVYHQALVQLAQEKGVPVRSKEHKIISHRGVTVHEFVSDVIVRDAIILELKVLPGTTFAAGNYAQLIHYLKCWDKDLGLLVNFAPDRVPIERVVWNEPLLDLYEDYKALKLAQHREDETFLESLRQLALAIGQQYGLGYPDTMYREIINLEANYYDLSCQSKVEVAAQWNGTILARHATDYLLFGQRYLVGVYSLLDWPTAYHFAQMRTHLKHLGLSFGVLLNFGKKQLQIYGVNVEHKL